MKKLLIYFLSIFFLTTTLNAQIIETSSIEKIQEEITDDTLVLFNLAEVLIDTETSLGTQRWRKFIRNRVDSKTHDELSFFVSEKAPPKAPESVLPGLIEDLQSRGLITFAFTSKGKNEWYGTPIPNVDLSTEKLLHQIGIDFSKTILNKELSELPNLFADIYSNGVIYGGNDREKEDVLLEILEKTGYQPSKIIFIEDKIESLIAFEIALNKANIPFVGYAYSKTAKDHENFDPLIANIQLDWLLSYDKVLTDDEAIKIKNEKYSNVDVENYFQEVIEKWKNRVN